MHMAHGSFTRHPAGWRQRQRSTRQCCGKYAMNDVETTSICWFQHRFDIETNLIFYWVDDLRSDATRLSPVRNEVRFDVELISKRHRKRQIDVDSMSFRCRVSHWVCGAFEVDPIRIRVIAFYFWFDVIIFQPAGRASVRYHTRPRKLVQFKKWLLKLVKVG